MKRVLAALFSVFVAAVSFCQTYTPVESKSKVHFTIDNFGIATGGDFKGIDGTIKFDAANPVAGDFDVTVDVSTIDTDIESRDKHLKRKDYFDVQNFPKISFKSTKITKTNKKGYLYMFGNITIKGVTKEIKFPFTASQKDNGFLFDGTFKLNRRDFKVGGNSISLSDELTVTLSVLAAPK